MEEVQELQIIDALVQEPEISVEDAVQQILINTSSELAFRTGPNSLGDYPWNTFTSLIEVVARTAPDRLCKLVSFLLEVQEHTVTNPTAGDPAKHYCSVV